MAGSLEGPLAKLARADSQVRELKAQVHAIWPPGKAWAVQTEVDHAGLEYRFYLRDLPPIDPSWGLLVGEILFNLRSALDHVAFELHVRRYRGRPIPPKVESASQFPICDTSKKWRDNGKGRIEQLAQRERRAIKILQPCNARNDQWRQVRENLSLLHQLHNIDKHRQLHLVATAQQAAMMESYPSEFGFRQKSYWGHVKPDRHIATWTFAKAPPKVKPHHGAFLEVVLDEYWGAVPLLGMLTTSTALVLRRFKRRFPAVTMPVGCSFSDRWWTNGTGATPRMGPYLAP